VSVGNENVYTYRYDVVDESMNGRADKGIFADHTSELYSIWGPNNTDANDPGCLKISAKEGGCSESVGILQSYWISFVKGLNPNLGVLEGLPQWNKWTQVGNERIVFEDGNATMESVGNGIGERIEAGMNQRQRCNNITMRLAKQANAGLNEGQTLLPFANGTRVDPTVTSGLKWSGNGTVNGSGNGSLVSVGAARRLDVGDGRIGFRTGLGFVVGLMGMVAVL